MSIRTTFIVASISIVLAIVIGVMGSAPRVGVKGREYLVRFEESEIEQVTLRQADHQVRFEKRGGYWFFVEPEVDRINSNTMDSLLDMLNHLTVLERLKSDDLKGDVLEEIGLSENSSLSVELKSGKETQRFELGYITPKENSVFARRSSGAVMVVDGNPHDLLSDPFETLRERQLVLLPTQVILKIAIHRSDGSLVLQRLVGEDNQLGRWQIVDPITASAEQDKVEDFLVSLKGLQIRSVDYSTPVNAEVPKTLPENTTAIELFLPGDAPPITLTLEEISRDTDLEMSELRAMISDRTLVYSLFTNFVDSLPKKASDLRDRSLADIPEEALESIVLVDKTARKIDEKVLLKAERGPGGVQWKVLIRGKQYDADNSRVKELIDRMADQVVIDFVDSGDLKEYGMVPQAKGVGFNFRLPPIQNADGSVEDEMSFAQVLQYGWKGENPPRLFANFVGEKEIYELDSSFVSLLPEHPLKWKSLNVLSINELQVRHINQVVKGRESLQLSFDNLRNSWTGLRNGVDVSANIDPVAADVFSRRLCSLRAKGWVLRASDAFGRLADPVAVFSIETEEYDPARGEAGKMVRKLLFADSPVEGLMYGQLEGNLDVFFIEDSVFRDLIRPVTSSMRRDGL